MQLYEVIRWGNDSNDPFTGGPNGPDTCFLVRAGSVEQAADLADRQLRRQPARHVDDWAAAVHLLGADLGHGEARVLRGPYVESAYRHGWRQWRRDAADGPWTEAA